MAGLFCSILPILSIITLVSCNSNHHDDDTDLAVMAIANLTNSIQQLLAKSIVSCPTLQTTDNDHHHQDMGLNEMVQLLLTQQILMQSKIGNDHKTNDVYINPVLEKILTKLKSQDQK